MRYFSENDEKNSVFFGFKVSRNYIRERIKTQSITSKMIAQSEISTFLLPACTPGKRGFLSRIWVFSLLGNSLHAGTRVSRYNLREGGNASPEGFSISKNFRIKA
jgi:hypothetical protein